MKIELNLTKDEISDIYWHLAGLSYGLDPDIKPHLHSASLIFMEVLEPIAKAHFDGDFELFRSRLMSEISTKIPKIKVFCSDNDIKNVIKDFE